MKVTQNLTNEDNEQFIFGIKDGVRGFYTDPSKADDSFVPFKGDLEVVSWYKDRSEPSINKTHTVPDGVSFAIVMCFVNNSSFHNWDTNKFKLNGKDVSGLRKISGAWSYTILQCKPGDTIEVGLAATGSAPSGHSIMYCK